MTPASHRRRTKAWEDSQPDLFIALPSDLPARDQQDLMERPFFSLSKNKRTAPIEYRVGENYIRVTANEKYSMATIPTTSLSCADQICPRRITTFWA